MRTKIDKGNFSVRLTAVLCFALAVLGIVYFSGVGTKWVMLLACLGSIALVFFGDLKQLRNIPTLLLLGYVLFSWLTVFWAMAGKFHLFEFSKIAVAAAVFLFIALRERFDRAFVRRVMGVIAGMSAIYAFMSVEAAATGVCKTFLQTKLPSLVDTTMEFNSARLYGIFGNSNIEASLYAIGIIFSIALLCGSGEKRQRILFAVTLSFNAFVFLLVFSMGAMVCFAAAVIVYLIAAGKGRGAALIRMFETAAPTVVFVFLATRFFNREGSEFFAVLLMLGNAAVSVVLELTVAGRLSGALEKRRKAVLVLTVVVVLMAALYAVAGSQVTGAYTFGDQFDRGMLLSAGEHTLTVDTDGEVNVMIYSQDRLQIMRSSGTTLYDGNGSNEIAFTVPKGTEIVFFRFSGEDGAVIRSAVVNGQQALPLRYKLLPGFIGNRIQNLTVSNSQIQRRMYREDGMKLFRLSPAVGSGVGAYETGITAVQDYPYETKYVHNHYIQILLEDGVIGFALFAASLLTMAAALWKMKKQTEESEFYWVYPALCAEFVMNGAQMLWDISMSMIVFTCMTYATYGLIVRAFAEPLKKQDPIPETTPKKGKKRAAKEAEVSLPRIAAVTATGLIALTLCGNLYAEKLRNMPVFSEEGYFRNLENAARIDIYEHNDSKLSYVVGSTQAESERYLTQANVYARELSRVQSNTIPRYLVFYYLQTGQYAEAIDEAMLGATYSATDADTWNKCAALLKQAFFDSGEASPLLSDGETLMPKLMDYYHALQAHNASALVPVELDENAQDFFDEVFALSDCFGDPTAFAAELLTQESAG